VGIKLFAIEDVGAELDQARRHGFELVLDPAHLGGRVDGARDQELGRPGRHIGAGGGVVEVSPREIEGADITAFAGHHVAREFLNGLAPRRAA
jgi:hypothetical protein